MSMGRSHCLLSAFTLGLLLLEPSLGPNPRAQAPEEKSGNSAPAVRPCAARAETSSPARKGKAKRKAGASSAETAVGCLEAKGTSVDLVEFFQSYVREQRWRISDEKIVEESWIFSRALDKDELLQFAKEDSFGSPVKWSGGKALVHITTHELDAGFTRVEVSGRFQGIGQNLDRFAPPQDSWELESTGALEKMLIDALEAHVNSLH